VTDDRRAPDPRLDKIHDLLVENLTLSRELKTTLFPDGPASKGRLADHEKRIGQLENWRNYLLGAWAVVSTFLGKHVLSGK
jgi:hypothetical protein